MSDGLGKPLPSNLDAERSVLGAILLDNHALNAAIELLKPEDFFLPQHRCIFEHTVSMAAAGQPIDLVTLNDELDKHNQLKAGGGAAYLAQLVDGVPRVAHVEHYARIVKQKAILRNVVRVAEAVQQQALDAEDDPAEVIQRATEMLSGLSGQALPLGSGKIRRWAEIPSFAEVPDEPVSWLVEGLVPAGAVTLIAAEPGGYKTWWAMILAARVTTGGPFLGRKCNRRDVLYLDRENPASVVKERAELLGLEPSENFRYWGGWAKDEPPSIGDVRLLEVARERKPVIIFDSFIRFHSADENKASEIAVVMLHLRALSHAGATVVVLHHRGKVELSRYRGSSDILAGVDLAFSVSVDREAGLVHARTIKSRFTRDFSLSLRPDFEETGDFAVTEAPNVARELEEVERLRQVITSEPGLTQERIVEKCGFAKGRARGLLHRYEGKQWRVELGEHNARRYYPVERDAETVEITL